MRLVSFGGVTFPEDNGESGLPVTARSSLITLPNGAFDQDGDTLYLVPAKLSRRCTILGERDEVDDKVDELLASFGGGRRILKAAMRGDASYRQTWAKLVGVQRERKTQTPFMQPLVIEFEQDYPFWLATEDEPWYLDNGEVLDDGLNLDQGQVELFSITASPTTIPVTTNTGSAIVRRGTIEIEPEAGATITDPHLENFTAGTWFEYSGTLTDTDKLVIDLLTKTVRLNGSDAYSNFSEGSNQVDWMKLVRGDNLVKLTATSISGTVALRWRWARHYL